jgi:hypothetical protein
MCNPTGWLDEEGKPAKAVRSKYHCEFCGSSGKLLVITEDLEDEGEEKHERTMGR